jgi:kinetochore protein NDC80
VGSPHAWPQLLGAIEWLVEILNYDKLAAEKGGHTQQAFGGAVEDLTREGDQRFVKYLDASYKAFLAGNDEHYAALEKEFSASFTQTTAEVGDLVKSEEGEQARLMTEIETEKSTGASVPEKKKKLAVLNNDHAKLEDFVKQLKEHESALDQKVATKRKDLSNGSAELAECKEKIVSLKERIAKQKLSADEARRMVDEKGRLEKNVKEATEYHQAMNQKAWEGDMELNRGRENLERAVHQYGTLATQLQLLPFGAKNANGVDFRILVNGERIGTAACLEDVISTDVTATIVPALRQKKDLVAKKGQALRESVNALQDKEEQSRKALESVAESLEKHQVGGLSVRRWIAPRRSSWGCDHHFTRNKATLTHMINLVD